MAREFFEHAFNRGLSIQRSPLRLIEGESYIAKNVEFDIESVKRRKGKSAAYQPPAYGDPEEKFAPSALARFYHLSSAGVVKAFFMAYNDRMYTAGADVDASTDDWDDDTATLMDASNWVRLFPPNETFTIPTLPFEHNGNQVSFTARFIKNAEQSRQWLYIQPDYASGDNNNELVNVPIRTACNLSPSVGNDFNNRCFSHGLYEPPIIDIEDVTATDQGTPYEATLISRIGALSGVERQSTVEAYDDDGVAAFALVTVDSAQDVFYNVYSGGAWAAAEQIGAGKCAITTAVYWKPVALKVDRHGQPHVVWIDDTTATDSLVYATKVVGGDWVLETVDSNVTGVTNDVSLAIADDGRLHVVLGGPTGANALHYTKPRTAGAAWSSSNTISQTNGVNGNLGFDLDLSGNLHVAGRLEVGGPAFSVIYLTSTDNGTTWTSETTLDTSGTDDMGYSTQLVVDRSDDRIHVVWFSEESSAGVWYSYNDGSWSTPETLWDGGFTTGSSDAGWMDMKLAADNTFGDNNDFYVAAVTTGEQAVNIIYRDVDAGVTWVDSISTTQLLAFDPTPSPSIWVPPTSTSPTGAIVTVLMGNNESGFSLMTPAGHFYRLTGSYDDGKLGESGPGAALFIGSKERVGERGATVTLALNSPNTTNYYQMAHDCSTMNIYRTARGDTKDGVYYRVGTVDFDFVSTGPDTGWEPDADFVDDMTDGELVTQIILDEDVFMPPKFRTHTFWKDRMVIGHLKARDLSATEGTELDLEDGGYHPNRIRFSRGFQPDRFAQNDFIDVDIGGGSATIQRVIVSRRLDSLMVFLEDETVIVTGDTPQGQRGSVFRPHNIPNADGTPAPDSVVEDNEGNIFAWTKRGIQVFEGTNARYITDNTISPLWTLQDSNHPSYADRINWDIRTATGKPYLYEAVGVYVPGEEKILWAYSSGTSSINDRVLVLDLRMWRSTGRRDGVFSIITGWNISKWAVWNGEGDRGELFGGEHNFNRGPWVYRCLFGDEDEVGTFKEDGTSFNAISSILNLGHSNFRRPDKIRAFRNLIVEADSADTDFAISMNLDDDSSDTSLGTWDFDRTAGVKRLSGGIPRSRIGRRAGLKMTTTDTLTADVGPKPWELHTISWEVEEIPSRRRP